MPDADLIRFERELGTTRAGMQLRMANHEARIAVFQIEKVRSDLQRLLNESQAGDGWQVRAKRLRGDLTTWQRAYIKACDRASEAIDALWDSHQWPADCARVRSFDWRPTRPGATR